jgi:hypothetical protein
MTAVFNWKSVMTAVFFLESCIRKLIFFATLTEGYTKTLERNYETSVKKEYNRLHIQIYRRTRM